MARSKTRRRRDRLAVKAGERAEERLATQAIEYQEDLDAKTKAVRALSKAIAENQRAQIELGNVQSKQNIARAQAAEKSLNAAKEELLSLKLTGQQIDNLYKLYSEKLPAVEAKTNSFAASLNSMAQTLEKQAVGLGKYIGIIPDFRDKIEELSGTKQVMADVGSSIAEMLSASTSRSATYSATLDAESDAAKKTIRYQNDIVKIQTQLQKLAQQAVNNAKAIGTENFKQIDTTETIAKINQELYSLNQDSSKLMQGSYGDLKAQLVETLNIASALGIVVDRQSEFSELLKNDIKNAKDVYENEQKIGKQVEANNKAKELADKKEADRKKREKDKEDKEIATRDAKRKRAGEQAKYEEVFGPVMKAQQEAAKQKAEAERKARRDEMKNLRDIEKRRERLYNRLIGFIGNLPLGGILSAIAALGPMFAIIAAIIGSILWLVTRWDKHITDIQKNLGITKDEATAGALEMAKFAKELGFANVYTTEIKKSIEELTSGLGIGLIGPFSRANAFAKELVAATTVLTDKFGMTGDEVANLTDMSTAMNTSLSSTTILVEKMAKGSFNIRSVFQTLAKLTPSILTAFRGSNAQLVAMALNAKRLGVEMGDIIQSSMSLLDVEDAISKAFEAQVVTGQNIDIDQLMYLKLTGQEDKLLQLQEQTLKSANYLNMKSPVSQQLIAESIGLSPDQASQIALRSIMTNQLGLTPDAIREMQKRGESVMDMLDEARKAGKITEKERELLGTQAQQYDALSIQEKLVRALDNAGLAISSSMKDLGNSISLLIDEISKLVQALGSLVANMPGYASTGMSILGGLALGAGGLFLLKKGKGLFSAGKAAAQATTALGGSTAALAAAGSSAPAGTTTGFMKSLIKPQTFGKALKSGGFGTLVGTGIEIAMGRDPGDAIIAGLASGAGAVLGGLVGGPVGAMIGGMALGGLADYFLEDTSADAAQQQLQAAQERNAQLKEMASRVGYQAATPEYSPMSTVEQKIDTTNALLQQLLQKQTDVTIELDNEKVGKAVLGYSAESFDRNRQLGNTFGNIVDSTANRKRG